DTRIAEIGEVDLSGHSAKVRLTSLQSTPVNLYSLWLIRLPDVRTTSPSPDGNTTPVEVEDGAPPRARNFLFNDWHGGAIQFSFHAELPSDGFVLVNELFYPGWQATVDAKPAEIWKADYIFRAIPVRAGSHRIEMHFQPRYFWLGAAVSLLTL